MTNASVTRRIPMAVLLTITLIVVLRIVHDLLDISRDDALCGTINEYRAGLLLCASTWPVAYSRLFPAMFKESTPLAFILGAVAPSLYIGWLSTKPFTVATRQTFGSSFAKDAVISTTILLLHTIDPSSHKNESQALKICLGIVLLSALLDADEDDNTANSYRAGVSTGLRTAALFTTVSVTLTNAL